MRNAARAFLPAALPNNPTYRKVNPADAPVLILALSSETIGTAEMYDVASTLLQQKLAQVEGVGQVTVGGSSLPAVRVELNPDALNKYGVSLEQVRATIAATNVNRPKGSLDNESDASHLATDDQLRKAEQYKSLIVSYRAGAALHA